MVRNGIEIKKLLCVSFAKNVPEGSCDAGRKKVNSDRP